MTVEYEVTKTEDGVEIQYNPLDFSHCEKKLFEINRLTKEGYYVTGTRRNEEEGEITKVAVLKHDPHFLEHLTVLEESWNVTIK